MEFFFQKVLLKLHTLLNYVVREKRRLFFYKTFRVLWWVNVMKPVVLLKMVPKWLWPFPMHRCQNLQSLWGDLLAEVITACAAGHLIHVFCGCGLVEELVTPIL